VLQRRAVIGDLAVIELGANDTTDVGVFTQRVDSMMGALATVPRVIWINQPSFAAGRSALDGVLTAAATRYPNLDVIDWSAQVAAHPDYVGADGLHLSSAGAQALAGAVAGRLFAWVVQNTAPSVFAVVGPAVGTALTRFATVLSP
jgi:lysophospholipase L1-like esterase